MDCEAINFFSRIGMPMRKAPHYRAHDLEVWLPPQEWRGHILPGKWKKIQARSRYVLHHVVARNCVATTFNQILCKIRCWHT